MPITIVTGPPGASNSTVAAALARSSPLGVHLFADECFRWVVSGFVPLWSPDAEGQRATAIDAVGAAAGRFADGGYEGYEVAVGRIVGPWLLDRLCLAAGSSVGALRYVVLRPSREVAVRRAVSRTGRHDPTKPAPVEVMYDTFADPGHYEIHVVDSSALGSAVTADVVRAGVATGRFDVSMHDLPRLPGGDPAAT